jgi:hypothetical protein
VRPYLNEEAEYADVSGLVQNDFGNQWFDCWDLGVSTYKEILVIYPDGDDPYVSDLELDVSGRSWEVVYSYRESEYADDLTSTWSLRSQQAHVYDLEVGFGRVPYDDSRVSGASYYRRGL